MNVPKTLTGLAPLAFFVLLGTGCGSDTSSPPPIDPSQDENVVDLARAESGKVCDQAFGL